MKIQTSLIVVSVALLASGCASKTERQFISGCKTGGINDSTCSCIYDKLEKKYGSDEAVWEKYPLDLLWDQVKECGENER